METAREAARLQEISRNTRKLILGTLAEAGSGHPGGSLSAVELLVTLYFYKMKHDPKNPKWPERDRFILSKGHAAPLLYSILAEAGYFPAEELQSLRKLGALLQGHPDLRIPGVEMPAGSEGIGLSVGVGRGARGEDRRKGLPDLRPHGRRRAAGGRGLGGRDVRHQVQAGQPHRDHRQERDTAGRAHGADNAPRTPRLEVAGVQLERHRGRRLRLPPAYRRLRQCGDDEAQADDNHRPHRQGEGSLVHGVVSDLPRHAPPRRTR